jgi:hypothetical protein
MKVDAYLYELCKNETVDIFYTFLYLPFLFLDISPFMVRMRNNRLLLLISFALIGIALLMPLKEV